MAAGAEYASGPGMKEVILAMNLIIVIAVVYFAGRKGFVASLKARSEDIRKKIFESKEELEKVSKSLDEVKSQLGDFEATKAKMFDEMKEEAEHLRSKIIEDATLTADRILEEAKLTAKSEASGAAADLRSELIAEAIKETHTILAESKDQQAMLHKNLFESLSGDLKGVRN